MKGTKDRLRSSLQIALRTSCARMKVYAKWSETSTGDRLDTTTESYSRRGNYESYTRSSLQIALRTSCTRMKVRRSGTNNSNWDGAAGLKRPRQTDQTLQIIHIITTDRLNTTTKSYYRSGARVQDETVWQ